MNVNPLNAILVKGIDVVDSRVFELTSPYAAANEVRGNTGVIMKFKEVVRVTFTAVIVIIISYSAIFEPSFAVETILRVGYTDNEHAPFLFEEKGEMKGLEADVLQEIAQENGYTIEWIPLGNFRSCKTAMQSKTVDIILGAEGSWDLKNYASYSNSICSANISVFIRTDEAFDYLKNSDKTYLAAVEDELLTKSLLQYAENVTFLTKNQASKAYEAFLQGGSQLLIGIRDNVLYNLRHDQMEEEYTIVNNYASSVEYYVAVRLDENGLLNKINYSLNRMKANGRFNEIYYRWIDEESHIREESRVLAMRIIGALLIFVAFVIVIYKRTNSILKRKVEQKTKEYKQANQELEFAVNALRNGKELREIAIEDGPSGIIAVDINRRITIFNQKACEIFHCSSAPIGETIASVTNLAALFDKERMDRLFDGEEWKGLELSALKDETESCIYRLDKKNLHNDLGYIRGAIFVISDVTEEIRMKNHMLEAEKSQDLRQMVGEISHEILNPLTTIKTLTQLIPMKKNNPDFLHTIEDLIPQEVDRITVLLRSLKDYSMPHAPDMKCISPSSILQFCETLILPVLSHEKITLKADCETDALFFADENQIKQAILNLMLNSIDAMKEKQQIIEKKEESYQLRIGAYENEEHVVFFVEDKGIGMTAEEMDHALKPFYTTKTTGTGLGLAITQRLIEENRGRLHLASEKGIGTRIGIEFRKEECNERQDRTDN